MHRLISVLCIYLALVQVDACGYSSCPQNYDPKKLNIHIISHSHDDVGWLKTPDGYFDEDVQILLSNVMVSLGKNSKRRFVEVEMYYFKRWWLLQTNETREKVHQFVKNGQLSFANGGWCINDEAVAHYSPIIDQMTFGNEFLRDTFGECSVPKLSWQIDPFGASREMAHLYSLMNFDGHVLNRGNNLHGEFLWENSDDGSQILSSVLHQHYSAPNGFNFGDGNNVTDTNKDEKAKIIVELAQKWNQNYGNKNHVLIPFGDDFRYKKAEAWFSNLDKLIDAVSSKYPHVNIFYSSPQCYIHAIKNVTGQEGHKLEVRTKDYFSIWTGYYTSRPQIKYLDRHANNLLQAGKQIEVLAELVDTQSFLLEGKNQLGVDQHHDAITGTSKPLVTIDYKQRLVSAIKSIEHVISEGLSKLIHSKNKSPDKVLVYSTVNISDYVHHLDSDTFASIVYNPLVHSHSTQIRIPIKNSSLYSVYKSNGDLVKNVSHVPIENKVKSLIGHHPFITHELVFEAHLPALGFDTFFAVKTNKKLVENREDIAVNEQGLFELKGKNIKVFVDKQTGHLKQIEFGGKIHKLAQSFMYYNSNSSSTYEFCPSTEAMNFHETSTVESASKYDGFYEINQRVNEWITQTIRVFQNSDHVEFDWIVGPIQSSNNTGEEIISRFVSDLKTDGIFYTDANGRQNIKRQRNDHRGCDKTKKAISLNYYPVSSRAFLLDQHNDIQLTVLTDRSVGASSLDDGQLEMMVHRRLFDTKSWIPLNDLDVDGKGVVSRGKLHLMFDKIKDSTDKYRQMSQSMFMQPIVAFTKVDNITTYRNEHTVNFSAIKTAVPDNVHLLTLENWGHVNNKQVLVRFENFYQKDDQSQANLSKSVSLDISNVFSNIDIEHTSSANLIGGESKQMESNNVTVKPQEIKTLVYKIKRSNSKTKCDLQWSKLTNGKVPENAIVGGYDVDNSNLYICRHEFRNDLIPGKYDSKIKCHITYGGAEHKIDDSSVEILTSHNNQHQWIPRHGGDPVPDEAFVGGQKQNGLPIYVGRCLKHNVVVGKIDRYFYYGFGGVNELKDCIDHQILTC